MSGGLAVAHKRATVKGGDLAFVIRTFGSNFTACNAEGTVGRDNVAVLRAGPQRCTVQFTPTSDGVDVSCKGNCNECREQGAKSK